MIAFDMLDSGKGKLKDKDQEKILICNLITKEKLLGVLLGLTFLILAPYLHLGFFFNFWTTKKPVDKSKCKCSCWDTIFNGSYDNSANPGYHHIYFNVTPQTLKIWAVTLCYVLVTYETCKFITKLCF